MTSIVTDADSCFQLGLDMLSRRLPAEALQHFYQSESLGADLDACSAQRWYCWMLLGEFENAWRESDAIARRGCQGDQCLWDGLPFDGKRVVIRCLHGFGDAIQFIRYAPLLRRRAARVIVESPAELVELFRVQPFIDQVISWSDGSSKGFDSWDQQIEVMELPRAFRTIPASVPYLRVRPSALTPKRESPNVGVVWSSSDWDPSRSLPLGALAPILGIKGITFHSFQQGKSRVQVNNLNPAWQIYDQAADCPDILSTAAKLRNMDLLITVDTMAAHLAGALGIPVWTLLTWRADWRWMIDRQDSPWYPTMRLYRQTEPGNWIQPVTAIARELQSAIDGNYLNALGA